MSANPAGQAAVVQQPDPNADERIRRNRLMFLVVSSVVTAIITFFLISQVDKPYIARISATELVKKESCSKLRVKDALLTGALANTMLQIGIVIEDVAMWTPVHVDMSYSTHCQ